jgi:hypothetical protein
MSALERSGGMDLRRHTRALLLLPLEFVTKELAPWVRVAGVGKDISQGGIFIETDLPAALEEMITVHLTLLGSGREMALPGLVRRTCPDGMGVEFGLLRGFDASAIADYVRTHEPPTGTTVEGRSTDGRDGN